MTEKEKLLENLISKSGKSKDEIEQLVNDKVNELSGLVSSEGAIYIVANELGVRLDAEKPKREVAMSTIEEITEAKKPVSLQCKVLRKYDLVNFSSQKGTEGRVQSLLVGDETGIIRIVFWNEQTENLDQIQEGDILKIINAFTRENTNSERLEIHYGQYSDMEVNPEGVSITVKDTRPESIEFTSRKVSDLQEGERNIKLEGVITDFDIPRYYLACPHTFKKVFQNEGKYLSPTHGEVEPIRVPIINVVVDDSTGSIPAVGFRDRAEHLTQFQSDDIIALAEDIDKYRDFSKKMIGSKVEVGGNINVSNMTGEKQLMINQVLNVEFKDLEEVAQEMTQESKDNSQSTTNTNEQDTSKQESSEKNQQKSTAKAQDKTPATDTGDDDDIDIDEIDLDDDDLL